MYKFLMFLLPLALLISCEKNVIGGFEEPMIIEEPEMEEEVAINKKGAAFSNRGQEWSHKTSALGAHWMYSWGNTLREEIPENVEFVPMFWGGNSVNQDNLDRIQGLINDEKVKFILGFNEPDGADQANMTVDQAIELWPQLEALGVPLVSPATVNPENDWMQEFMRRAEELEYRIDYVAVHHYGGVNVQAFLDKLESAYAAYDRPIWITEFAVADWNASTPEENRYTEAQVNSFMEEVLPLLDEIPWVHRYAWFNGGNAALISSALFDSENDITMVGQTYADNVPNVDIGPGVDTEIEPEVDPDELLVNGGFEAGIAPWAGFKNGAVGVAVTEPKTGLFCGRIENGDGSLLYRADVVAGTTYVLSFSSKWSETIENTFSAKLRDDASNDLLFSVTDMPKTDQWEDTSYEFTIPEGVTKLKMSFFKGQGFPPFFMDDVSLKIVE